MAAEAAKKACMIEEGPRGFVVTFDGIWTRADLDNVFRNMLWERAQHMAKMAQAKTPIQQKEQDNG